MTLRTAATFAVGVVACAATTGCELMVPLMISESSGGSGVDDYGYDEWGEPLDLEVELDDLEIDVGVPLTDRPLTASGHQLGQSTYFEVQAEDDQDIPIVVAVELCPIEDVIDWGDESSAYRYVTVTRGDEMRWAEPYDMEVSVTESADHTERTVRVAAHFPEGGHVDLTLRYGTPY